MVHNLELFVDGDAQTLEQVLNSGDHRRLVLVFGALVRVFTLGQIARLTGRDLEATKVLLDKLHYADRWIDRLDEVKLPKYCGGSSVSVYSLTARGAAALKRIALAVHKHARPGQPLGKWRANLPHDLLIAEAFLWLHERYRIFEFLPETELKSRIGKARVGAAGRPAALPEKATGDFKVHLFDGGRVGTVECAIAIHHTPHQIAARHDRTLWFTSDERQADLIETVTGSRPVMLGGVAAPQPRSAMAATLGTNKKPTGRKRRTFSERVLVGVDRLGGCTTVNAVSSLLQVNRGNVCKVMNRLAAAGRLGRMAAHLRPGQDRGRPATLYFRAEAPPANIHEKVRALIIARAVVLIAPRENGLKGGAKAGGYRMHEYDKTKLQIEFRHRRDYTQPALLLVVDDPSQAVGDTYARLRVAEAKAMDRNVIVAALVASPTRIAQLKALCKEKSPGSRIVDVWQLGRSKSPGDGAAQ